MATQSFQIVDRWIEGREGAIPVRDYLPTVRRSKWPLLWIHGGGWSAGGLDQKESDGPARAWAAAGRYVRTIDYRLAPKVSLLRDAPLKDGPGRFPAGLHDVLDVIEALGSESSQRIDAGGASAGANLAVMATLCLRQQGKTLPHRLALAYGAYHGVLPTDSRAYAELRGPLAHWAFNPKMYHRIVRNYLGGDDAVSIARAFPSGTDLEDLPPTLLVHAGNDRLHASGLAFAQELLAARVAPVEVTVAAMHGFLSFPGTRPFRDGIVAVNDWLDHGD